MADIFGNHAPSDYSLGRNLVTEKRWDDYVKTNMAYHPMANPEHDFNALERWQKSVPEVYKRATESAQAVGYLTDNLLAIQTMTDEIMYTAYRLPMFVHINTMIAEGAASYGVRVQDRVGRAARVSAPGYEAPSASGNETLVTQNIHLYGIDAEWSVDELRGAMFAGTPLDTQSIDAAITGTLETLEAVALTGGGYAEKGLLNLDAAASPTDDQVHLKTQGTGEDFASLNAEQIRQLIVTEISNVIQQSRQTLGRNINTGMTVYLPGGQYDLLTSKYIGDNADRTIMRSLMEDNPWTHFTGGSPIAIESVLELENAGVSNTDRMVIGLKHERVAEIGVSIMPRVLRILDKGRVVCAQVEAKFSPLFVKRPNTIRYVDGV